MPTDLQDLGLSVAEAIVLKKRLWKRGFHCFEAAKDVDPTLEPAKLDDALKVLEGPDQAGELEYALLEFQLYTRWSPRLGVIQKDEKHHDKLVPSDGSVRTRLDGVIQAAAGAAEPGGAWNAVWESCLAIWEEPTSPASDNHGQVGYCCPVRIERLSREFEKGKPVPEVASEKTPLDHRTADRANVWFGMNSSDVGHLFCARDVSGWFGINAAHDPAYLPDPDGQERRYDPPAWIGLPDGLHRRLAFAKGAADTLSSNIGPVIMPWEATEFRPKLLGAVDRERIRTSARWGGIFRIIRAVAQMESKASFDCMQAYDRAFLSLPLVHAAAAHGETGTGNELGGLVRWLERPDNCPVDARKRFKALRLISKLTDWRDGESDEDAYDTGAGERACSASGVVSAIVGPAPLLAYRESLEVLRRPHMVYRFAMHLRTQPVTRDAMWRLAVHRLRQVAWLRIPTRDDLPEKWHERPLGEVVHSEQAMALLLRYAVKSPGAVFTNAKGSNEVYAAATSGGKKGNYEAKDYALLHWMKQAWESAKKDDAAFQTALIEILRGKTPFVVPGGVTKVYVPDQIGESAANMTLLLEWHSKFQFHLHESEVQGRLNLSNAPGSSPFVKKEGNVWRLDDAHDAWWEPQDGHAPPAHAPSYLVPASLSTKAKALGLMPALLGLVGGEVGEAGAEKAKKNAALDKLVAAQTARELHAAVAGGFARASDGSIVATHRKHALASHGAFNQRWSRLYLHEFVSQEWSSLLVCGNTATRPAPEKALWALDAPEAKDRDVHAFDSRDGTEGAAQPLARYELVDRKLRVRSLGDSVAPPAQTEALAQFTDRVYQAALGSPVRLDQFSVVQLADKLSIRLGTLRQVMAVDQAIKPATASDIGLFVELLAWRVDTASNPTAVESRFLRETGFGLRTRRSNKLLFSFGKPESKIDSWAPTLQLLLGLPKKNASFAANNAELALCLLSWPALHRFRTLLRQSEMARHAMRDVWRIGLRSVLNVSAEGLGLKTPTKPQVFHLFQSEPVLAALAHWVYDDVVSFKKAFQSKPFKTALAGWLKQDAARTDVSAWSDEHEITVFWNKLLPQLPDGALKQRLIDLRPSSWQRTYRDKLAEVIDLAGLDGTELPGAKGSGSTTGFLVTPPTPGSIGVALLATPALDVPAVAIADIDATALSVAAVLPDDSSTLPEVADGEEFWISGIAPVYSDDAASWRGASLQLPSPVRVRIRAGTDKTLVQLFAAGSAPAEAVELPAGELLSDFDLTLDVAPWLGGLGEGASIELLARCEVIETGFKLSLGLRADLPWLRVPLKYPFTEAAHISDIKVDLAQRQVHWHRELAGQVDLLAALPFRATGSLDLTVGLDSDLAPEAHLRGQLKHVDLQLGSPVATLRVVAVPETDSLGFDADFGSGEASLALTTPDRLKASLHLELAAVAGDGQAARVIPSLNRKRPENDLLAPINIDLGEIEVPDADHPIRLSASRPEVPAWVFAKAVSAAPSTAEKFSLLDVNERWFGDDVAGLDFRLVDKLNPVLDENSFSVSMKLEFSLGGEQFKTSAVAAAVPLVARCKRNGAYLDLSQDAFACEVGQIELDFSIPTDSRTIELGSLAALHLPEKLQTQIDLSGKRDTLSVHEKLELHIPAQGGFVFELDNLSLGRGGVSLTATVRRGQANLEGLPSLSNSLNVRPASDDGSGSLRIERGRLVSATIKADARLKFFDDADGVLSLTLFQDGSDMGALATFDLPLARTFNVRALYLEFQVDSIQLGLSYVNEKRWSATGGMTGSIAFQPSGALSDRLSEYGSLFDGTQAHFENLDLANLGEASVRVLTTPRTFKVAGLFEIVMRGFEIHSLGHLSLKSIGLIGDIRLLTKLPDMRASLTLGDIRLWQPSVDSRIPKIKITSLGVSFALASGFEFEGRIVEYDDDHEYGFGGEVRLKTDVFPASKVMLKLTRIPCDGKDYPSVVVYGSMDRTDSLAYGFFLRLVGIGVAINQGLRGFSDQDAFDKPMGLGLRVEKALRSGIADPGKPESWSPMKELDKQTFYSLVAQAQVSYGLLSRDTDHPFMSTMVLSINDRLDIVAGVSGWLMVSPDDALRQEFIDAPAVRGAVGLSPREQVLYGRFMTMKNARFGPSAERNVVGKMLRDALNAAQLSTSFYCDPRGTLLEIAYPRQARFDFNLGPANGLVEAGFRFGYYRGTHVVGMNLAASAKVSTNFSADLGFANVELSATAAFLLQGSFAGALTNNGDAYILAELVISALFEISARLHKRIRMSGFWGSFDVTLFDLRGSARITATASVSAALVPAGLGFDGSVTVWLDICGFGFSARLQISSDTARVSQARSRIYELVPPIGDLIGAPSPRMTTVEGSAEAIALAASPLLMSTQEATSIEAAEMVAASAEPEMPTQWCYHVRIVNGRTRVVLYPDSETGIGYPALPMDKGVPGAGRSHTIVLKGTHKLLGVLGGPEYDDGQLTLLEQVGEIVIPKQYLSSDDGTSITDNLLVGNLLASLGNAKSVAHAREIFDPRTHSPVAGDFDDPAVLADPRRRSTRFRKRHRAGEADPLTYDDHLLLAAQTAGDLSPQSGAAMTDAELLIPLLRFAEDPEAAVKHIEEPGSTTADGTWQPNPNRMASTLSLVLEFEGTDVATALAGEGITAIAESTRMFGVDIAPEKWSDPAGRVRGVSFKFDAQVSQWFLGRGEVGLTWQITRTDGVTPKSSGPANHRGIRHFRVRREVVWGACTPETFEVLPCWVHYQDKATHEVFYIRPQFQFVDNTLPQDQRLVLRYVVQGVGDPSADRGDVLCQEVFDVDYRPANPGPTVVNSQAILHRSTAGPEDPAGLELLVAVDLSAWPVSTDAIKIKKLAARLKVYSRPVLPGNLGVYGAGDETDVSLEWRQELQGNEIRLPQPVASRRMSKSVLSDAIELVLAESEWLLLNESKVDEQLKEGKEKERLDNRVVLFRARIPYKAASSEAFWQRLMAVGGTQAVEYYVQLGSSDPLDAVVETATPIQRMRLAVTAPGRLAATHHSDEHPETAFSEGREVGAIERVSMDAPTRRREWLPAKAFRLGFEVKPRALIGADSLDVKLRLQLQHQRDAGHEYGPPVGYRLWAREVLDDLDSSLDMQPLEPVRQFTVLPEKVWQAFPSKVVVKQIVGAGPGPAETNLDWRFEREPLWMSVIPKFPFGAKQGAIKDLLAAQTFHDGSEGVIHAALKDFIDALALDKAGKNTRTVRVAVDEPLSPPRGDGSSGDIASRLLERYPQEIDAFGWLLLEALGACATIWVEVDDDRIEPKEWGIDNDEVAIITFDTLDPQDRGPKQLELYAARVFVREVLVQLCSISNTPGVSLKQLFFAEKPTALEHALQWLCPRPNGTVDVPASWLAFINTLTLRSSNFATPPPDDCKVESLKAAMWRVSNPEAVQGAELGSTSSTGWPVVSRGGSASLPEVEGVVTAAYRIGQGYASDWRVAVEVIRRYDWLEDRDEVTFKIPGSEIRDIQVPRTADLEPEVLALSLDPADGNLRADVQVPPAQRAHLYRSGLRRRVQYAGQTVRLERSIPKSVHEKVNQLLELIEIDWDALEETWTEAPDVPATSPLWYTVAGASEASYEVKRGRNLWRYPFLPAVFEWRASAVSQAGLRYSDDLPRSNDTGRPAGHTTFPLRPMFEQPNQKPPRGLQYQGLQAAWEVKESQLVIAMPFARAIDSLPMELRSYWAQVDDEGLIPAVDNRREIPALELPDMEATYVVQAQTVGGANAEICRIVLEGGKLVATMLVSPYRPCQVEAVQFSSEYPWPGRLGLKCTLDVSAPELAWLDVQNLATQSDWHLSFAVDRDGARFDIIEEDA
jgi:hypothetical protein